MSNIELANTYFKLPIQQLDDSHTHYIEGKTVDDLELIKIKKNKLDDDVLSSYQQTFKPTSRMGFLTLPLWSKNYTDDTKFLKESAKFYKNYKSKQNVAQVDNFLETWNKIKSNTNFREKYYFFNWNFIDFLNKYSSFLQLLSLYNLASPVLSFIVPILMLFLPLLYLRWKGRDITTESYIKTLKEVLKNHALGLLFTDFKSLNWQKRIYSMGSFFFFFFNIYQNFLVCLRFRLNMIDIHKFMDSIRSYITYTVDQINNMVYYIEPLTTYQTFKNDVLRQKQILSDFLVRVNEITPFRMTVQKLTQIGTVMQTFFTFYTDNILNQSFLYSFGFHGFLNQIEGLQGNLKSKMITYCNYSHKKTEFKQLCHPALCDNKPIRNTVKLNKNMIITGPNAAGKTTIIKSTIINLLLSQQIGCGFYEKATIYPYQTIHCYINIPDTSGRDSLFQAEARRCKEILDDVYRKPNTRHFCIFDELYSGTNPYEAVASAYGYLDYLIKSKKCTFILTTHFINLCKIMNTNKHVKNYHMIVNSENEELKYTYQMKQGISNIKGGTFVLRQLGYPDEIIKKAIDTLDVL